MKSKDLQTAMKNKYENGDGRAKAHRNLGEGVTKQTITLSIEMINNTGSINLCEPPGAPRIVCTSANMHQLKTGSGVSLQWFLLS